jgi:mono/diheme cytochrome c family protein
MRQIEVPKRLAAATLLLLLALGSCFAEPDKLETSAGGSSASLGGASGSPDVEAGRGGAPDAPRCVARPALAGAECRPVTSGEPLRARVVENVPQDTLLATDELYSKFKASCGACHGSSGLGGLSVTSSSFASAVDEKAIAAIQSDNALCELDAKGEKKDPTCFDLMPPSGPLAKPWSERKDDPNDQVTQLAALLKVWVDAGRPADAFIVPAALGGTAPYAIDAETAETFTNIGTCIPDAGMVATELDESCALDAKFVALEKHPDSPVPEEQLGLPTTLDQTDLTTFDSAELARHGVVAYVPTYPLWSDGAGKLRYIRVPQGQSIQFNEKTRQFDIPKNTRFYKTFLKQILDRDGVERFRKIETRIIVSRPGEDSLFGTYRWNEEETQATLVVDAQRDGLPFRDQVITIVNDLAKADKVQADWKAGKVRNYTKELDYQGLQRRYAIPGSERCIQCHMGGPGQSFVLGFSPLELYTRPCAPDTLAQKGACDGGIIEPLLGDELTQLERFIDYGVVTGYDIKTQLVSLEDPQGSKNAPRNFRTPEELRAQGYLLGNCAHCHNPDGYPSVLNPELKPLLNFRPSEEGGIFEFPLERYSPRILRELGTIPLPYITPSLRDIYTPKYGYKEKRVTVNHELKFIDAPWRSLIYRNVDTPFTYCDDATIFPHMPLNTPGFDCRAPRILGEWMVSIPALRKNPDLNESAGSDAANAPENDPQPYREVKPGDPDFLNGSAQAQKRLATYRAGLRSNAYCPDTSDIIDVWGIHYAKPGSTHLIPWDDEIKGLPAEGVPDHPHWVETDLTETPGDWNPRRVDWKSKVVEQNFGTEQKYLDDNFSGEELRQAQQALDAQKLAVQLLQSAELSGALRDFAKTPLPLGLWQQHEGCDFSGVPKLRDVLPGERALWMDNVPDQSVPVYYTLPGAAVFNMICVNCHGPDADSKGRQATTLQEMTGGAARVANFRDGLFGPYGKGGENRQRIFGTDVMAQRYLAWMALGGTSQQIPSEILQLVAATQVLGVSRPEAPPVTNANMLETARALCRAVVQRGEGVPFDPISLTTANGRAAFMKHAPLISSAANGDSELWEKLCLFDNPSPIHGIVVEGVAPDYRLSSNVVNLFRADAYPTGTAVGNVRGGREASLSASNSFPWCMIKPTDAGQLAFVETQKSADGKPLSSLYCPPELITDTNRISVDGPEVASFATRGAINAGFSVFAYLDDFISQGHGRALAFNECEQLNEGTRP